MRTLLKAVLALAAACGLLVGAMLISSGYAQVDKLGATHGYVMMAGGAVLMIACYVWLKYSIRQAKATAKTGK